MSLVNPDERWWRRERALRTLTIVLWAAAFLVCAVTGWSLSLYLVNAHWSTVGHTSWVSGTDLPLRTERVAVALISLFYIPVILATAVDFYRRHRRDHGGGWAFVYMIGAVCLGSGIGVLVSAMSPLTSRSLPMVLSMGALLVASGVMFLLIKPLVSSLKRAREERRRWSRMHGTPTQAEVTDRSLVTTFNVDRWKTTLKFRDNEGNERWHTTTIPVHEGIMPEVGARYTLRYDPRNPGRKSTIYVDLSRRQRSKWQPKPRRGRLP